MPDYKLNQLIGVSWNGARGDFALGTHALDGSARHDLEASFVSGLEPGVNAILRDIAEWDRDRHHQLAAAVREPIEKVVPYVEMYNMFFMPDPYELDADNKIPIEDIVTIAFETHADGAVRPVRAGYRFTRPGFMMFDTAIDLPWDLMEAAGWNVLARQMRYAVQDLARKRDQRAENIFVAALQPSHVVTVSGGALTKAAIDTVLKNSKDAGFPVSRALVNPGTLADMTDFTWPTGQVVPENLMEELIRNQVISNYGGVQWTVNPNFPTNRVRFGGTPAQIGYHQTKGRVKNSSDMDIINGRDLYAIRDQYHAWYVANDLTLWEIRIEA